jgi:hypothetical protein
MPVSNGPARFSVLPALLMTGILHINVVEGSFDMELFNHFIKELLDVMTPWTPDHPPNSVIVLDNCQVHKDPAMKRMVEAR